MRKVSLKNYIILIVLCIFTIAIVIYLSVFYNNIKKYQAKKDELSSTIVSISGENIELSITSYILENPNTVLYFGSNINLDEFISYINTNNLSDFIIYCIDFNYNKLYNYLVDVYSLNDIDFTKFKKVSAILFKDGKIYDISFYEDFDINIIDEFTKIVGVKND